tara:strand:+ start:90 stop:257 length:168 start_codon:yes stop_codon:yes gene_type:complete
MNLYSTIVNFGFIQRRFHAGKLSNKFNVVRLVEEWEISFLSKSLRWSAILACRQA